MLFTDTKKITKKMRRALTANEAAEIAAIIKKQGIVATWFVKWSNEVHGTNFTLQDISRITSKKYQGVIGLQRMKSIKAFLNLYLADLEPITQTDENT